MAGDTDWLDGVLGALFCPTCGAVYRRDDLFIDDPWGAQHNVICRCHVCARRAVCIVVDPSRIAQTDGGSSLTIDDVLDAHRLLASYHGDANHLFLHPAR